MTRYYLDVAGDYCYVDRWSGNGKVVFWDSSQVRKLVVVDRKPVVLEEEKEVVVKIDRRRRGGKRPGSGRPVVKIICDCCGERQRHYRQGMCRECWDRERKIFDETGESEFFEWRGNAKRIFKRNRRCIYCGNRRAVAGLRVCAGCREIVAPEE